MHHALKMSLLVLTACLSAPAYCTTDCPRAQNPGVSGKAQAVIAYLDPAAPHTSDEEVFGFEAAMQDVLLFKYLRLLKLKSASIDGLQFFICSVKTGSTLTKIQDVNDLTFFNVTLAIWRAPQADGNGVAYAVIPQLLDKNPADFHKRSVVASEAPAVPGEPPLKIWVQSIQRDDAVLMALLGLGLGSHLLAAEEFLNARLVLCKSKKDLRRSLDSLLRPQKPADDLMKTIDELLLVADKRIADKQLRADKEQQRSIDAACTP